MTLLKKQHNNKDHIISQKLRFCWRHCFGIHCKKKKALYRVRVWSTLNVDPLLRRRKKVLTAAKHNISFIKSYLLVNWITHVAVAVCCLGNLRHYPIFTFLQCTHLYQYSVRLHAQLNLIKAIGKLQLSSSTRRRVNRFIARSMSHPGAIGGAVPISTSGNRATGWPLYVTSNNNNWQLSAVTSLSPPCSFQSRLQRVRAKVNFPQFISIFSMGDINPTATL